MTYTPEEIHETYNWEMFVFLLVVFISLTNQVRVSRKRYSRNSDEQTDRQGGEAGGEK